MGHPVNITIRNVVSEIPRVNSAVDEFAERQSLSPRLVFELQLALEEALVNTISHGYADSEEHEIIVRMSVEQDNVSVTIEDDARPFNPLQVPEPDFEQTIEQKRVGGLGIHLIRNLFQQLQYSREHGKNILVMKKQIAAGAP